MKLLVTGGAGFIGSAFVRHVLSKRRETQIVNLDTLTYAGNLDNLADIAGDPRYRFVRADICDAAEVRATFEAERPDVVVHFAAETHVDRSILSPDTPVRTNVDGTAALLDVARTIGVRRFVHISTDEVYGSIVEGSWTEASPLDPNVPYAAAKAGSDLLALAFHRTRKLDVVVTRCTNNYGHHQFPEKVIPLFVTNLLDGRRVPLYGSGGNKRDWLHVSDHCRAVQLVLNSGRAGEVYHIGGGTELSNLELTGRLLAACGRGWDMVDRVADRQGHDWRYSLDISKISRELGYTPEVSFEDGLAATIQWYRDNRAWWEPLRQRAVVAKAA
jgi:dTDP-glucose 4,6-dehydratase